MEDKAREARLQLALTLRKGGATFSQIGKALGVGTERARQVVVTAMRREKAKLAGLEPSG